MKMDMKNYSLPKTYEGPRDLENIMWESSELIEGGGIPPPALVRKTFGLEGQKGFWASFVFFFGANQKSGVRRKNAHFYDSATRFDLRKKDEGRKRGLGRSLKGNPSIPLTHDSPEDSHEQLKDAGYEFNPQVVAHVTLDVLSKTVGSEVAYGAPLSGRVAPPQRKGGYGGVYALTNFNDLVLKPILTKNGFESIADVITAFDNEYPKHSIAGRIPTNVSSIYNAINTQYESFCRMVAGFQNESSPIKLSDKDRQRIVSYVKKTFVRPIRQAVEDGNILTSQDLEKKITFNVCHVRGLLADNRNLTPFDCNNPYPKKQNYPVRILAYGNFKTILYHDEKPVPQMVQEILYRDYVKSIGQQVRQGAKTAKQRGKLSQEDYEQILVDKIKDNTDNVTNVRDELLLLHMFRKAKILTEEVRATILCLRELGVPEDKIERLYHVSKFQLDRLEESIKGVGRGLKRKDTMFNRGRILCDYLDRGVGELKKSIESTNSKPFSQYIQDALHWGEPKQAPTKQS